MIKKIIMVILVGIFVNVHSQTYKRGNKTSLDDKLIGVWIHKGFVNGFQFSIKANDLEKKGSGMELKLNGIAVIRGMAGGCGTPPIAYSNYEGTWSVSSDSIITLNYKNWEGHIEQKIQIITVDSDTLKINYLRRDNLDIPKPDFDMKSFFESK
jgi:hypothetical protein